MSFLPKNKIQNIINIMGNIVAKYWNKSQIYKILGPVAVEYHCW